MKTLPTAEEFRIKQCVSIEQDLFNTDLHELMIEFAKLHVEAALKAARPIGMNEETQMSFYPLNNIK
jgi:hypothetical protein